MWVRWEALGVHQWSSSSVVLVGPVVSKTEPRVISGEAERMIHLRNDGQPGAPFFCPQDGVLLLLVDVIEEDPI